MATFYPIQGGRIYSCRVNGEVVTFDVDIPDRAVARCEAIQHRGIARQTWVVDVFQTKPGRALRSHWLHVCIRKFVQASHR